MNKLFLTIIGILCVGIVILYFMYNLSQNKVHTLETKILTLKNDVSNCKTNLSDCNKGIEEFNNAQIQASNTIQEIKTVVRTVKEDCDCFNTAVDDKVLAIIRRD